ncbi:MAG: glycosyltransferase [Gemmobacter sp.]
MRPFHAVHRDLLALYLGSTGKPSAAGAVRARLADLRREVVALGTSAATASYANVLGLLALRIDDPGLVEALALDHGPNLRDDHGHEGAGAGSGRAALRLMVTGIGRSGTTLIYQQLAKLLLLAGLRVNFRYEPYLWDIRTPATKGNRFGIAQLSPFGLHVHTTVPLFLDRPDALHDRFADTLFAAPWDGDGQSAADAHLTKVIRGSGRLRAHLARNPDLRIVACLRNPLDTINSGLGMFSFFGEEFHTDDRPRLKAELAARGGQTDHLPDGRSAIEWYAAWWRAFTDETLAVARDFPGQVFPFCYEAFQADPRAMLDALQDFTGLRNEGILLGLGRSAGPSIKATSLTRHDLALLAGDMEFYREGIMAPRLGPAEAAAQAARLVARYIEGQFSFPIAGSDLGQRSPIQLRGMMLAGQQSRFQKLVQGPRHPVKLGALVAARAAQAVSAAPLADPAAIRRGKTFGAVVTCHNNAATIVDAVLSCLGQTLPFDRILVVDDRSADASPDRLAELERLYSSIRVLRLEANLGPSAARDMGFRRIGTDFVTQLDGDDLFWPTKNETEAAAVAGDETAVAFSDILLITSEAEQVQSTAAYEGDGRDTVFARLLARTRQIPRDMTLSRARYLAAGGYDRGAHLYEDWDFKLRLAAQGGPWRRATGVAGTVYNRMTPGLSGVEDGAHGRALALIFLRALAHGTVAGGRDGLLAAFDAAMGRFGDQPVVRAARLLLDRAGAAGGAAPAQAARLAASRAVHAMDSVRLAACLTDAAAGLAGAPPVPAAMARA